MEIRNAIAQTRPQMEQHHCRFIQHPTIPIGSAGANALKEPQKRFDPRNFIKRRDDW
jgi:hypothetical protein